MHFKWFIYRYNLVQNKLISPLFTRKAVIIAKKLHLSTILFMVYPRRFTWRTIIICIL